MDPPSNTYGNENPLPNGKSSTDKRCRLLYIYHDTITGQDASRTADLRTASRPGSFETPAYRDDLSRGSC